MTARSGSLSAIRITNTGNQLTSLLLLIYLLLEAGGLLPLGNQDFLRLARLIWAIVPKPTVIIGLHIHHGFGSLQTEPSIPSKTAPGTPCKPWDQLIQPIAVILGTARRTPAVMRRTEADFLFPLSILRMPQSMRRTGPKYIAVITCTTVLVDLMPPKTRTEIIRFHHLHLWPRHKHSDLQRHVRPKRAHEQTDSSGTVYTFSVPNSQGGTSPYTVNLEQINVSTNFGQSGITEHSGTIWVIQSVELPDGTSYSFGYDSGTSGNYGLLTSMALPTGGVIQYGYNNNTDAYGNLSRWLESRTTPDGPWGYTPVATAPYCPAEDVGCVQKVVVTKPSGDTINYSFVLNGGAWPYFVQYNTGSSTLLATTSQCFSFANMKADGTCTYSFNIAPPATNVVLLSRITNVPTPSGGSRTARAAYALQLNIRGITTIRAFTAK